MTSDSSETSDGSISSDDIPIQRLGNDRPSVLPQKPSTPRMPIKPLLNFQTPPQLENTHLAELKGAGPGPFIGGRGDNGNRGGATDNGSGLDTYVKSENSNNKTVSDKRDSQSSSSLSLKRQSDQISISSLSGVKPSPSSLSDISSTLPMLFSTFSQKLYFRGLLYKKNLVSSDGRLASEAKVGNIGVHRDRGFKWEKWWVELWGSILRCWKIPPTFTPFVNSDNIITSELRPSESWIQGVKAEAGMPIYINITDSATDILTFIPPTQSSFRDPSSSSNFISTSEAPPPLPYTFPFTLSSAGSNLFLFASPSSIACNSWVAAIRLSCWESGRLSDWYSWKLLRGPNFRDVWHHSGCIVGCPEWKEGILKEGEIRGRVNYGSEWTDYWCVVRGVIVGGGNSWWINNTSSLGKSFIGNTGNAKWGGFFNKKSSKKSRENSTDSLSVKTGAILIWESRKEYKKGKEPLFKIEQVTSCYGVWPEKIEVVNLGVAGTMKIEGVIAVSDGVDPNSLYGFISKFTPPSPEKLTSIEKLTTLRSPPEFFLLLANNATEMAKWCLAIWNAFGLEGGSNQHDITEVGVIDESRSRSSSPLGWTGIETESLQQKVENTNHSFGRSNITSLLSNPKVPSNWGPLFLTTSEIGVVNMHGSSFAMTKIEYESILADKIKAKREGKSENWVEAVNLGAQNRNRFELDEISHRMSERNSILNTLSTSIEQEHSGDKKENDHIISTATETTTSITDTTSTASKTKSIADVFREKSFHESFVTTDSTFSHENDMIANSNSSSLPPSKPSPTGPLPPVPPRRSSTMRSTSPSSPRTPSIRSVTSNVESLLLKRGDRNGKDLPMHIDITQTSHLAQAESALTNVVLDDNSLQNNSSVSTSPPKSSTVKSDSMSIPSIAPLPSTSSSSPSRALTNQPKVISQKTGIAAAASMAKPLSTPNQSSDNANVKSNVVLAALPQMKEDGTWKWEYQYIDQDEYVEKLAQMSSSNGPPGLNTTPLFNSLGTNSSSLPLPMNAPPIPNIPFISPMMSAPPPPPLPIPPLHPGMNPYINPISSFNMINQPNLGSSPQKYGNHVMPNRSLSPKKSSSSLTSTERNLTISSTSQESLKTRDVDKVQPSKNTNKITSMKDDSSDTDTSESESADDAKIDNEIKNKTRPLPDSVKGKESTSQLSLPLILEPLPFFESLNLNVDSKRTDNKLESIDENGAKKGEKNIETDSVRARKDTDKKDDEQDEKKSIHSSRKLVGKSDDSSNESKHESETEESTESESESESGTEEESDEQPLSSRPIDSSDKVYTFPSLVFFLLFSRSFAFASLLSFY